MLFIAVSVAVGITGYNIGVNSDAKQDTSVNNTPVIDLPSLTVQPKVAVKEALNYSYDKLTVKLPMLVNGGEGAQTLNKKILNQALAATYYTAAMMSNEDLEWGDNGFTVAYDYCEKNDVIAIYVNIVENSTAVFPGTGDGVTRFNFFYDVKADKELSFDEGVTKMDISDYVINKEYVGKLLIIENGIFLREYKAI